MRRISNLVGVMLLLVFVSACASQESMYAWGGYNRELLSYYKNPAELDKFAGQLYEDIEAAEAQGKIPPGLYAEYGYAMLELGDARTAVIFFEKEQAMWPESAYLMTGVIKRLGPVDDQPGESADTEDSMSVDADPAGAPGGEEGGN